MDIDSSSVRRFMANKNLKELHRELHIEIPKLKGLKTVPGMAVNTLSRRERSTLWRALQREKMARLRKSVGDKLVSIFWSIVEVLLITIIGVRKRIWVWISRRRNKVGQMRMF